MSPTALSAEEKAFADRTIAAHLGNSGGAARHPGTLQERHPHKFLSAEVLEYIAAKTDMPLARVYSVVTFYALFNLEPQGKHTICICRGTACHTRGSRDLLREPDVRAGASTIRTSEPAPTRSALTTPDGKYTIRTVACFGQCALAPGGRGQSRNLRPRERADAATRARAPGKGDGKEMTRIQDLSTFSTVREAGMAKLLPFRPRIAVGMGTCGAGNGAEGVYHAFADAIDKRGLDIQLAPRGLLRFLRAGAAGERLDSRPAPGDSAPRAEPATSTRFLTTSMMGNIPTRPGPLQDRGVGPHHRRKSSTAAATPNIPSWREIPFFKGQKKIVLRNCGLINPDDVEEYIAVGGYQSLYKVLIDNRPGRW